MEYEWDYEVFLFKTDLKEYKINREKIKNDIRTYISADDPMKELKKSFDMNTNTSYFCNTSYKGFYGIGLYDYLEERMKENYRIFGKARPNNLVGSNDLRTVNALAAHEIITGMALREIGCQNDITEKTLVSELKMLHILIMHYIDTQKLKDRNKVIRLCREIKNIEFSYMSEALEKAF